MNLVRQYILLGVGIIPLCSCTLSDEASSNLNYSYTYDASQLYPVVNTNPDTIAEYRSSETIDVPDSYHVGSFHSPVSFKDRDKTWASSQNPQSYTIEIAQSDKASLVAKKLYKTPKNDRMAQLKYQSFGKTYYKGVYGTYPDETAAQNAFNALPEDIKQGASIQRWGSMQRNME